jgi:hypothetical protein
MPPKQEPQKNPQDYQGFEKLLHQNEVAEAAEKASKTIESIEERIRKEAPQKPESIVKTIRTYRGDVEESVASGKTTMVGIAAAEAQAGSLSKSINVVVSEVKSPRAKKIYAYSIGVLLIAASAAGLYKVYDLMQKRNVVQLAPQYQSLVPLDKISAINVDNLDTDGFRKAVSDARDQAAGQLGTMNEFVFVKNILTEDGDATTVSLTAEGFFQNARLSAPAALVRSLGSQFLFGVHIFDGNQPFLVFTTSSYEAAFDGMLDWEPALIKDIGYLLRNQSDFHQAGTSSDSFVPLVFKDMIVKNIDARVVKNASGKILLAYAFPSRNTLIIAVNPETVGLVYERIVSRRVVR